MRVEDYLISSGREAYIFNTLRRIVYLSPGHFHHLITFFTLSSEPIMSFSTAGDLAKMEISSEKIEHADIDEEPSFTPEEEKALVRKIDMTLLPTIWIMYLLSYMDRTKCVIIGLATIKDQKTDSYYHLQHRKCKDFWHGDGPELDFRSVFDCPGCFLCGIRGV